MSDFSRKLIHELLKFRAAEPSATRLFSSMKHDADLLPKFRSRIQAGFSAFDKYQRITYEIQGLRDEGTDIVLKERGDDYKDSYFCFQIKSEWDIEQEDYLKTLKAQLHDTRNRYQSGLREYFIVLCFSVVTLEKEKKRRKFKEREERGLVEDRTRKNKIREIERAFAMENVSIIEPEFALTFLQLSNIQVDAIVKSKVGDEDIVLKEALDLVSDLSPTETITLLYILWLRLYQHKATVTPNDLIESSFIQRTYSWISDLVYEEDPDSWQDSRVGYETADQVAYDMEFLEDRFTERNPAGEFSLPIENVKPLAVLMMDGDIRYDYVDAELLEYLLAILKGIHEPPSERSE